MVDGMLHALVPAWFDRSAALSLLRVRREETIVTRTFSLRSMLSCLGLAAIGVASGGAGGCEAPPDCPARADIHPGGSCSSSELQCNYDAPRTACDGTTSSVASSCLCQGGHWSCPDAWTCEAGTADGGEDADATTDDATDAPSVDDSVETKSDVHDDSATDAPTDAPSETHDD